MGLGASATQPLGSRESRPASIARERGATLMILLVGGAIILGGASAPGSLLALAYQLVATVVMLIGLVQLKGGVRPLPWPLAWALLAIVALVVVQVLPLPLSLWRTLPGRAPVDAALAAAGVRPSLLAVSFDPNATLAAIAALAPAFAVMILQMGMTRTPVREVAGTIAALALVSWVLGVLQFFGGKDSLLYFHSFTNWGLAVGFFANANHLGTLLLVGLPAASALVSWRMTERSLDGRRALAIIAACSVIAATGISLTGSVGALALLGPVVLASVFLLPVPGRKRWLVAAGAVLCAGMAIVASTGALNTSFADSSSRPEMWRNTHAGIETFWPLGAGLGTFPAVYPTFENERAIGSRYANHAHNDYLEWLFETGLPGALVMVAALVWWAWRTFAVWRARESRERLWQRAASIAMGAVLAHSAVDYPLRTPAILVVFAFFAWVLASDEVVDPPRGAAAAS